MSSDREIISIFRSSKKDEMYVYVRKSEGAGALPEALTELFGAPVHVMDMLLDGQRQLARASADKVLEAIRDKGFYLQMPPPKDDYMLDLHEDTAWRYRGDL